MWDFIKKYWLEAAFGLLLSYAGNLHRKLTRKREEEKHLKRAMCALLRAQIIEIYNKYNEKEYFPIYQRENLRHLTEEYYCLGGNGVVKGLEEKLLQLPTERQ